MSVETLFNSNAKLETRTQTLDAFGGIKESFAVAQSFSCRIQPTSAEEQNLYNREGMTVEAKAYVSHRLNPNVTDRVIFGSRTFLIRGVLNPDEADLYKVLYLEEQS
jgi:SPP1 family predicted phage head-tail adaptor